MQHSVFIDKIGTIFNGGYNDAVENYERYKEYSQMGIGLFAEKNVYLLGESGNVIKSCGSTRFDTGGTVAQTKDFVKDFILGKKINSNELTDDFSVLENSVLIYKSKDGQHPLISRESKNGLVFHKRNFSSSDYMNSLSEKFREICIKNAIKFEIR